MDLDLELALHFFKNIVRILSFWLLINGRAFKMIFRNEFRTDNLVKHAGVSERGRILNIFCEMGLAGRAESRPPRLLTLVYSASAVVSSAVQANIGYHKCER